MLVVEGAEEGGDEDEAGDDYEGLAGEFGCVGRGVQAGARRVTLSSSGSDSSRPKKM